MTLYFLFFRTSQHFVPEFYFCRCLVIYFSNEWQQQHSVAIFNPVAPRRQSSIGKKNSDISNNCSNTEHFKQIYYIFFRLSDFRNNLYIAANCFTAKQCDCFFIWNINILQQFGLQIFFTSFEKNL